MRKKVAIMCVMLLSVVKCFSISNVFDAYMAEETTHYVVDFSARTNVSYALDTLCSCPLASLVVSGVANQTERGAFVRVLLEDKRGQEYVVLESCRMYNDMDAFCFKDYGEETLSLPDVVPYKLKIFVKNADIHISEIVVNKGNVSKSNSDRETYSRIRGRRVIVQQLRLVSKINSYNHKNKKLWRADTTALSLLPWEQKRKILGIECEDENTGGIEYYAEGIFETVNHSSEEEDNIRWERELSSTLYVDSFDWRSQHGKNWMTPVRHQGWTHTCWAFATIGACEAVANLFYNKNIGWDLSEQELVSCSRNTTNPFKSSSFRKALSWIKANGVVNEEAFPYDGGGDSLACSINEDKITEHFFIGGYKAVPVYPDSLKKYLLKYGPLPVSYRTDRTMGHGVVLTGFGRLKVGDGVRSSSRNNYVSTTIENGDSRIGKTYWICKNSYGIGSGENGYIKLYLPDRDGGRSAFCISPDVTTLGYTNDSIEVSDNDGDGFFFWGFGKKPKHSPNWIPDQPDGDDNDYTKGPMDEYGFLKDLNPDLYDTVYVRKDSLCNRKSYVYQHTMINSGATLSVTSDTNFYGKAVLRVAPLATLVVDSAELRLSNIAVEKGGRVFIKNNGRIKLDDDCSLDLPAGAELYITEGAICQ